MSALLEGALAMAIAGWGVIPLHTPSAGACDCRLPDCPSPGKHPRTKNGLRDATTDAAQIRKWWGMWPTANIGAVVPDDCVVVDVDVADPATVFAIGELPQTAASRTGRGSHHAYRTGVPVRPKVGVREHVDLCGPGSYIVVPPSLHVSGARYEWVVPIASGIADAPGWIVEAASSPRAGGDRTDDSDGSIPEGERNARLTSLAGTMRRRGMTAAEIEPALLAVNAGRCHPPLSDREVRMIAASVGRYEPEASADEHGRSVEPAQDDAAKGEPEAEQVGHLSRQSLAARHFVRRQGDRVRFDHGRRSWLIWHGHRWRPDRDQEIRRLWLEVLSIRYQEAFGIIDSEMRDRTLSAIRAAGATDDAIAAGLRIAAAMEPAATAGDAWDPDPWMLGCENGLVDLRTGELRVGQPTDMISRSTRLEYDPGATCPRWDRFLVEVFAADEELIAWFARLVGASLVGTSKEIIAVHYGSGNNGKSVAFRTLGREVAGDYSVEIPVETLLNANRTAGAPTSDLMRLRGARLAFTSEPEQGAKFKGGTLKRLATIDLMSGRELHGRQEEWPPTHTIHLATNHLPAADDASEGFWRRIALIPWAVRFAKSGDAGDGRTEDPKLATVLAGEAKGILAWAIRGAVAYVTAGTLHPFPAAVARETASYRDEEDPIGGFLTEWVVRDNDASTSGKTVYEQYVLWAGELGTKVMTSSVFGRAFTERHDRLGWPVNRRTVHGRVIYDGLTVRRPVE
jgi:putative DNA primase/helicase